MLIRKVCALWVLSLLAVSSPAWAQRHGGGGYRSGHLSGRYSSPQARTPGLHSGGLGYARPGQSYGFHPYPAYRFPSVPYYRRYPQHPRPYVYFRPRFYPIVPFGFRLAPYPYSSLYVDPYWPGAGYGYSYSSPYTYYSPGYSVGDEPPRATELRPESRSAAEQIWLLALNDGSIRAATDYWQENDTLHYLTREGKSASVPLSELDLSFTTQLNRERGLEFSLPKR